MNITDPANAAIGAISQAQNKVNQAARDIATLAIDKQEVGKPEEFDSRSTLASLVSLHEAENQARAGVKVLQADKEMNQNIIDIFV